MDLATPGCGRGLDVLAPVLLCFSEAELASTMWLCKLHPFDPGLVHSLLFSCCGSDLFDHFVQVWLWLIWWLYRLYHNNEYVIVFIQHFTPDTKQLKVRAEQHGCCEYSPSEHKHLQNSVQGIKYMSSVVCIRSPVTPLRCDQGQVAHPFWERYLKYNRTE